jgi:hypothetical protein
MRSTLTGLNVPMPIWSVILVEDLRCEVQARGRRGDRAAGGRVDGLIRLPVALPRLAARDVGRQRRHAEAVDLLHVAAEAEDHRPFLFLHHLRRQRLGECDGVAGPDPLGRTAPGLPRHRIALARQEELDRVLHLPFRAGEEAGRDDAGVVDDQHVAGVETRREIREGIVLNAGSGGGGGEHHHARPAALARLLRDELRGQFVREIRSLERALH